MAMTRPFFILNLCTSFDGGLSVKKARALQMLGCGGRSVAFSPSTRSLLKSYKKANVNVIQMI